MRALSSTLQAAIANPVQFPADKPRLTIYATGGTIVATRDVAGNVPFSIGSIFTGNALDPATLEVTLYDTTYQASALTAADPFDGVRMVLDLVIGAEALVLFDGTITSTKVDTVGLTLTASGAMSKTDEREGVLRVGLDCPWTFAGTDCGVTSIPEWTLTVDGDQTTGRVLYFTTQPVCLAGDALYLPGATVPAALVAGVGPFGLSLDTPLSPLLEDGDTVTIKARCQKHITACARHSNQARFGGCPLRPVEVE